MLRQFIGWIESLSQYKALTILEGARKEQGCSQESEDIRSMSQDEEAFPSPEGQLVTKKDSFPSPNSQTTLLRQETEEENILILRLSENEDRKDDQGRW